MHRRLQTVLLVVVFAALALATQAAAATWTFKASLPEGLADMGSTKGPSGLIYAIGGSSQASLVSSAHVYAYSESSNSWAMKAPLPRGRSGLGAATLGGVVYAVGGCGPRGPQSTVYLYHEGTNSWTIGTPLPARRCQVGVATSGGRLYVIGGWSSSPGTPSRSVYAFNPSKHTWSTKAQLPTTRDGFAVATDSSGRIYVIGGYCCGATLDGGAPGDEIARVDRYNPATNTWARVAGMPSGLVAPTARRASDGRIYVVGGGRYARPRRRPARHEHGDGVQPQHEHLDDPPQPARRVRRLRRRHLRRRHGTRRQRRLLRLRRPVDRARRRLLPNERHETLVTEAPQLPSHCRPATT